METNMSTVVLTPTHIASDHAFLEKTYPHQRTVDLNHPKIFIHPKKIYLIGVVGAYLPDRVDSIETWDVMGTLFTFILSTVISDGLQGGHIAFDQPDIVATFTDVFEPGAHVFLVTKDYRFVLKYKTDRKCVIAKKVGPYAGIGSGGMYAAGLAMNTKNVADIFKPLHQLDHLTSEEHTVIALSQLTGGTGITKEITALVERHKKGNKEQPAAAKKGKK
jgi:hypothetical protein